MAAGQAFQGYVSADPDNKPALAAAGMLLLQLEDFSNFEWIKMKWSRHTFTPSALRRHPHPA